VLAAKHKYTKFSYLYLLTNTHRQGNLSLKLGKYYLIKQAIMEESPSAYRWFGYMFVWMLACLLILDKGVSSELFLFILLLVAIVLNGYCAYKFALEKGTFLAILAFVVAMVLDFFPIVAYFVIIEIFMA
jgi:hypothetical protein